LCSFSLICVIVNYDSRLSFCFGPATVQHLARPPTALISDLMCALIVLITDQFALSAALLQPAFSVLIEMFLDHALCVHTLRRIIDVSKQLEVFVELIRYSDT
jgi:hypothetical protein